MPHFIVEYSANVEDAVDMRDFCETLRVAGLATGIFPEAGIRVRAYRSDAFAIADGRPDAGFIDITVRLRAGRTMEVRKDATKHIFDAAEAYLEPLFAERPLALSFEMRNIDPDLSPKRNSIRDFMNKEQ